jgi:hypothetical protein
MSMHSSMCRFQPFQSMNQFYSDIYKLTSHLAQARFRILWYT